MKLHSGVSGPLYQAACRLPKPVDEKLQQLRCNTKGTRREGTRKGIEEL
jgi:hypothetical protein